MNGRIFFWSLTSALAGFLFGFDTVVISGAEKTIQSLWGLSPGLHGIAMASALYGTVVGSLLGGWPADRFGRKATLLWIGVLYFVGAVGSGLAPNVATFIAARVIGGLGIGISTVVAPMYISEIAPPKHRGRLAGMFQFNIVFGILIAFVSNALLAGIGPNAWRWMLGVAAFPSLLYVMFCFGLPESPRWLLGKKGEREAGLQVLQRIEPDASQSEIAAEADSIIAASSELASSGHFWTMRLRRPILLAILIAFFNQMSGINAILYFAPRIFELTGLAAKAALLQSIGIGVINLVFTFVGLWLIGPAGPAHASLYRLIRLHYFARPRRVGLLYRTLLNRAGLHLRVHRSPCDRPGSSHLGSYLRDISQSSSGGRTDARQLHTLDLCRLAHNFFPGDGH
jgi:SP family arabinose:H+ symporter-like MFS transporter